MTLFRKLGRTGMEVSALGMRCWAIGNQFWAGAIPRGGDKGVEDESPHAIRTAFQVVI